MKQMRTGVDIVSVKRLKEMVDRYGDRFLDRIFTPAERAILGSDVRRMAGRFAAKEAISKALGTGIGREGIRFRSIEVLRDEGGLPRVLLHEAARLRFERLGGVFLSLSLSHENEYAVAFCLIGTQEPGDGPSG